MNKSTPDLIQSTVELLPLGSNLLVAPTPAADRTSGGIIVPEAFKSALNQGTVLDKGKLCSDNISVGELVFFQMHSESRLEYNGTKYIIVDESACLGKITKSKTSK